MKYDLLITDYDGTLGWNNDIHPQTIEAINKFTDRGGKFVICTGRMYAAIRGICARYNFKGLVVSFQGAQINDIQTGELIREGGLDYEFAARAIEDLRNDGTAVAADIDDYMYCEKDSEYTKYHREFACVMKVNDLKEKVLQMKKTVRKVVTTDTKERIAELTKKYQPLYKDKAICNNGSDLLLEVINPEFSKGSSVRFLANYFNIPLNKVMAVGDSTNDIELVRGEWHGVAVGDAKEELKKVAKEVTVPFSEQPIKHLIEKYCL